MADLRIVDAPEIPTENITGEEKLPTGGNGNYSISLDSLADYTKTKKDLADNTSVDSKVNGVRQELDAHIEDLLNPHQVTKGQVGLGNVDNTADADKPVSNSTQAAIISAVTPKADKTYVDNALSSKSDKTYVDAQLAIKANKADVYIKSETYTKQESNDLVNSSISTALTPVNDSLDLAKRGVANRYDSSLTYNSGERVVLTNGDIVKSTIDGNTNDPNVDMTRWVKDNSASQIFDASGKDQQELNNLFLKGVPSYATLKTLTPLFAGQQVELVSHVEDRRLGGGTFEAVAADLLDDGGYTCRVNNQWAWRRCSTSNIVYVTEFGLTNGGQLDTPLDNAIKYALANGIQSVYVPTTGKNDYQFNGGLSYELRNSPIMISAGSMGRAGQRIQHNGANIGITFKSFGDMWSPAVLLNLSVNGTQNGIAFARFSDSWQNHFDHSFVTGYENGSIAEIYNEANWTENFCSTNVTSRDCKFGFYFHRNPDENPSSAYQDKHATESFYRTKISNFNFQHGIAGASVGIVIGDPTNTSNAYSHCNMYSSEIDIGGWFEGGGNSSAIFISDGSIINISELKFKHDGIFSLASPNPPYRLVNLGGSSAKLSNSKLIRQDTQVGIIDINNILVKNGTTDLFPFRSVCYKASEFASQDGVDNFDATVSPIKFKFSLNAGEFATISLQRFFKASEYRIKVTQNDAISNVYRYHSQGLTNVGFLVCETLHPKITTTLNTSVTPNTASSQASLPDSGTAAGVVVKLLGNQPQGAYDSNNFLGCEVYVPTVASDSTFTVMIEKIS